MSYVERCEGVYVGRWDFEASERLGLEVGREECVQYESKIW